MVHSVLSKLLKRFFLEPPKDVREIGDSQPVVSIFAFASDNVEALKDIDDIVNSTAFHTKSPGGIINRNGNLTGIVGLDKVFTQEAKRLVFATVGMFLRSGRYQGWCKGARRLEGREGR
jgi:hypothetical protein